MYVVTLRGSSWVYIWIAFFWCSLHLHGVNYVVPNMCLFLLTCLNVIYGHPIKNLYFEDWDESMQHSRNIFTKGMSVSNPTSLIFFPFL
jgi:hypothetical protein